MPNFWKKVYSPEKTDFFNNFALIIIRFMFLLDLNKYP